MRKKDMLTCAESERVFPGSFVSFLLLGVAFPICAALLTQGYFTSEK